MRTFMSSSPNQQRGITLMESLIAFLVLSLGMLAAARFQTQLRLHADIARQRSEAVRLAQEDLERLRAFAVVATTAGVRAYADIVAATTPVDASTRFVVSRSVESLPGAAAKNTTVSVGWTDAAGAPQQVVLNSIIAGSNPALSGALALAPSAAPVKGPMVRSVAVPIAAKDLGNGSSVFKPVAAGGVAIVFSNTTGQVIARCTGIASATTTSGLSLADLSTCDSTPGALLSGQVRFTANEAALPFTVSLALTGGPYTKAPECASDAKTTAGGEPYASYHCVVYPLASTGTWSGRSTLVPSGWTLGVGEMDWRVCRYTADLDGNGTIDSNLEHPADYRDVAGALTQQNFRVVKGTQNCPLGSAVSVAGTNADVYANLSTAQHQP